MFGRRARELKYKLMELQTRVGSLEKELGSKTSMAVHGTMDDLLGYHYWANISHTAVLQHLLDKAGLELTYIKGKPADDACVGIQKKNIVQNVQNNDSFCLHKKL